MKSFGFNICYLGCDPEFFFSKNGKIFGAEKVLPENGIIYEPGTCKHDNGTYKDDGAHTSLKDTKSKIVIDGVQAELNPRPNTCRANLGNEISACFRKVYDKMKEDKSINIDFSQVIEISQKEMDSLSEKSKMFGCAPSNNIYNKMESRITVNPKIYRKRSAGGHIHLGSYSNDTNKALKLPERVVPMLDILLGNTCVLIDKNECNKERRKVYGRAGEYRTPAHGIEYRTLSNFWLQSYQLMSFVTGMARFAVNVIANSLDNEKDSPENEILNLINKDKITEAINNNDYNLALKNFLTMEKVIVRYGDTSPDHNPLNSKTIDKFKKFIEKDINYWFKENPLEHWLKLPEGHGNGWETFAREEL